MPNSRFHDSGTVGIVFSDFQPYQRLSLVAYPFDWLETLYHYTDIDNFLYSPVFAFSGNQTYKDKGFDIKIKILNETKQIPSLALGFRDLAGTGLFSSEYIVANKMINSFDVTAGIGWGILNNSSIKNPLTEFSDRFILRSDFEGKGGEFSTSNYFSGKKIGFFGGIEYLIPFSRGLKLKAEFDSTNYGEEGFFETPQKSRFNFGISYSVSKTFKVSFGYIRGNESQFSFSFTPNLGTKNPLIKKTDNYEPVKNKEAYQKVTDNNRRYLYLSSLNQLTNRKLNFRSANISDDFSKIEVAFAQTKYLSYPRAIGRAISVLDDISPESIKEFSVTLENIDFEMVNVEIEREKFKLLKENNNFGHLNNYLKVNHPINLSKTHEYVPKSKLPRTFFDIAPSFQTHIGGPDRFLIGGINILAKSETLFRRDLNLQTILRTGLVDTFNALEQPSDSILPRVRSDIIEYLKEGKDFSIVRLQVNYFQNPFKSFYTRLSAGILEEMYAGYGAEVLYRPFNSFIAIGADAYKVYQRDYDQKFSLRDYEANTGHVTLYVDEPNTKILFRLSGGKYLAGDSGFTFDLSKRFKSGVRMGAFFTLTDISKEEFGEGSFDKGFYVDFPLEIFFSSYRKNVSTFGLKPLTRDGGAKVLVGHDLWGVTESANLFNFLRDLDDFYE